MDGYLHGLGFFPAWWPQSDETSYMPGQGSKDGTSNNQSEVSQPSVTLPPMSHSVTFPYP